MGVQVRLGQRLGRVRVERKLGSLGLPVPSTDALIVDLDTGLQELSQGEQGEIAISGPQVMKGYLNRPEENEAVFREINGRRYLLTGDIGYVEDEGFFILCGRKKEMVIIGGYKVYPREVDEVLYTHPQIVLAAVIGITHERMGTAVKAFIVPGEGQGLEKREVIQFCKQHLAGYKVPRLIEFRDHLPTLPNGKVNKLLLIKESTEWTS